MRVGGPESLPKPVSKSTSQKPTGLYLLRGHSEGRGNLVASSIPQSQRGVLLFSHPVGGFLPAWGRRGRTGTVPPFSWGNQEDFPGGEGKKMHPPVSTGGSEEPRKDFFISDNRAAKTWAEWIAWHWEEAGYTTGVQAGNFRPGSNLGGRRNPAVNGNGGADGIAVPGWRWECRYRATFPHDTMSRQEKSKRGKDLREGSRFALRPRAQGRKPLVVLN